jgi:hypothetical protein
VGTAFEEDGLGGLLLVSISLSLDESEDSGIARRGIMKKEKVTNESDSFQDKSRQDASRLDHVTWTSNCDFASFILPSRFNTLKLKVRVKSTEY